MRNLKRVLSLALALVMMLGMMVIGANAASTDFADADEITYTEAVEVMAAIGVLKGDGTNFNPTDILTREQAAKIICYMLVGPATAEKLAGTDAFTDVAADRWSAPYIAYCANLGIIAGVGDNAFDPEGQLTGVAFAKMLLVALGNDPVACGYVGGNWATSVAVDAMKMGLDLDGVSLAAPLTREQASQMAFTALKYTKDGGTVYMVGDVEFDNPTDAALYAKLTGQDVVPTTTTTGSLGDKVFGLAKGSEDVNGLTCHYWKANGKKVSQNYMDDVYVTSFAAGTTAAAAAKAMGVTKNNTKSAKWYSNGVESVGSALTAAEVTALLTAPSSVVLEVPADIYVDADGNYKIMTTYEYVVAAHRGGKVTDKTSDNYGLYAWTFGTYSNAVVYAEKDAYTNNAYYLVVPKGDNSSAAEHLSISIPETVQGKITAKGTGYVKIGTDKFVFATDYKGPATLTVGTEYVLYLATDGTILNAATPNDVTPDTVWNYGYLSAYKAQDYNSGDLLGGSAAAAAEKFQIVTAEGKTVVFDGAFTVKSTGKVDKFVWTGDNSVATPGAQLIKYSLDEDGKIDAVEKMVTTSGDDQNAIKYGTPNTFKKGEAQLYNVSAGTYRNYVLTSDTVFFYVHGDDVDAYVGYQNAPSFTNISNVEIFYSNGTVLAALIPAVGETPTPQKNLVYVAGTEFEETKAADGTTTVYINEECYVDGELTTITFSATVANEGLYEYTVNSKGIATLGSKVSGSGDKVTAVGATYFKAGSAVSYVSSATEYYQVTDEGVVAIDGITLTNDTVVKVIYVPASTATEPASVVYITVTPAE